uniref:Replication initiator protein n=2 Tax=unclassified Microvirus TaxID=338099 RepID=A0AAU8B6J0_9VIRU
MPCYHPLFGIPDFKPGTTEFYKTESGKPRYRIFKAALVTPEMLQDPYLIQVPCGHCIGCRLEYSRQWANRMMLELQYHEDSWFVTLTYDDYHVPIAWYTDDSTGETCPAMTLNKRDWQLFMKRLRKMFPDQRIRFYMAGEYGDHTFRPHFHAILFGLKLPDGDLTLLQQNADGFQYFSSKSIDSCWKSQYNGLIKCEGSITPLTNSGKVVLARVSWETCAYVARYVTKKLSGPETKLYSDCNISPPFALMSRKPGIGRQWFDDHPDCYDYEYINISTPTGGRKFRPPRYYDKLFEQEEPELSKELKNSRKQAALVATLQKMEKTDKSYFDMLVDSERAQINRIKGLERRLEDA